jgi:hypothetical protein
VREFIHFEREKFERGFDREPFEFTHELSSLAYFSRIHCRRSRKRWARRGGIILSRGARRSRERSFYDVPSGRLSPLQALETLDQRQCRILLKRPENPEPRFRELLDALFKQVLDLRGGLGSEHVVRLERHC